MATAIHADGVWRDDRDSADDAHDLSDPRMHASYDSAGSDHDDDLDWSNADGPAPSALPEVDEPASPTPDGGPEHPVRAAERRAVGDPATETSTWVVGGIVVEARVGDLTTDHSDCVVNAANEDLVHEGGLARALANAAGPELQEWSDAHVRLRGRLEVSAAVASQCVGRLPCKCVVHAVGPRYDASHAALCEDQLRDTVSSALDAAAAAGAVTVALPPISSGLFRYPKLDCARAIADEVYAYCSGNVRTRRTRAPRPAVQLKRGQASLARIALVDMAWSDVLREFGRRVRQLLQGSDVGGADGDDDWDHYASGAACGRGSHVIGPSAVGAPAIGAAALGASGGAVGAAGAGAGSMPRHHGFGNAGDCMPRESCATAAGGREHVGGADAAARIAAAGAGVGYTYTPLELFEEALPSVDVEACAEAFAHACRVSQKEGEAPDAAHVSDPAVFGEGTIVSSIARVGALFGATEDDATQAFNMCMMDDDAGLSLNEFVVLAALVFCVTKGRGDDLSAALTDTDVRTMVAQAARVTKDLGLPGVRGPPAVAATAAPTAAGSSGAAATATASVTTATTPATATATDAHMSKGRAQDESIAWIGTGMLPVIGRVLGSAAAAVAAPADKVERAALPPTSVASVHTHHAGRERDDTLPGAPASVPVAVPVTVALPSAAAAGAEPTVAAGAGAGAALKPVVGVFWDIENCGFFEQTAHGPQLVPGVRAYDVVADVKNIVSAWLADNALVPTGVEPALELKAYARLEPGGGAAALLPHHVRSAVSDQGFAIEDSGPKKGSADIKIIDSLHDFYWRHFHEEGRHVPLVVLISGDADFLGVLRQARYRGIKVGLVHRASARPSLRDVADYTAEWDRLLKRNAEPARGPRWGVAPTIAPSL